MKGFYCELNEIVEHFGLKVLTPEVDYKNIHITTRDINRPGIQLTGFLDYFDKNRIQIVGQVEAMYLKQLAQNEKLSIYTKLMDLGAPCYIFCRDIEPDTELINIATKKCIPIFSTQESTTDFMSLIIKYLGEKLAPSITLHGCLVDINGVGVFIRGESGIGKSEAVLELIKRGHRMVSDDAVEIYKASEKTLFGKAPKIVRDFLEIRGIGIVDIKTMFGVQSVKETQSIELVVTLQEWDSKAEYDRLGDRESFVEILGNKIVNYDIPLRPGRNVAVILEAAALSYRQRQMGYNDTAEFIKRANEQFIAKD
ncbi:Hpr(Ser) kinase/phosphatase [Lachnotalea glycerini]|uniref:HPr kinase/phosphorylase n=1 Tax=Lachnotalea glycerini TaxID=1763509 RepID=A0A255IE62_9FIRM|nr:HPr(Ser) kinase/phosphatase [Lachnotalea glycerini]PXV91522.1 Hpr(Ser) kinase/phosphatase [Lachnotalea glycerini]RDY29952.1 HPr(Ser) kinase/phosphatase [Lachnotalea glycerini]